MNNPRQKRIKQLLIGIGIVFVAIFIAIKGYHFGQWLYHQFH